MSTSCSVHVLLCRSQLIPARENWLLHFQGFCEPSNFPLITWNCSCWMYLRHGNPETSQIRALHPQPQEPVVKRLLAHHGTRVIFPAPPPPFFAFFPQSLYWFDPYPQLWIQLTVSEQPRWNLMPCLDFFSLGEWLNARSPIPLARTLVFIMNSTCWAHPILLSG